MMQQKAQIKQQIAELLNKAAQKPMPEDPLSIGPFMATLLAAKMAGLVLQDDLEQAAKQQQEEASKQQ